jgi:protocatechuate 3,4-dioxygenase beta subunit
LPADGVEVMVEGVWHTTERGSNEGVYLWEMHPNDLSLRAWPKLATTDRQGRLQVSGIGRDHSVRLTVRDMRYAQQHLLIETTKAAASQRTSLALEPAVILKGRVLAADTGIPIPSAIVSVMANRADGSLRDARVRADAQGHFQINPFAGESYTVTAFATASEPYLIAREKFSWSKGTVKANHDIKVPRGMVIQGKLTEARTGRPLAGSSIQYMPANEREDVLSGWQTIVGSQADGTYRITVAPGKGYLLIFGPTPEYVLEEIGSNQIYRDKPGGWRHYAHKIIPYEARVENPPTSINAELQPAVRIKGRVEGPQGQAVKNALMLTTLRIEAVHPSWRNDSQIPVRDGRFELNGLAPDATTRVSVLDADHEWGATVELSGKQASEDVVIRLQPCGQARARFVGPDGKPRAKHQAQHDFEFVAKSGPPRFSRDPQDRAQLSADTAFVANIDQKHYGNGIRTDAEGRIVFATLIPGATYRIIDSSTMNDANKGIRLRKDFTVNPGEILELGDILIEKP